MAIVQAKCENCGTILSVDSDLEFANCSNCGIAFVTKSAIELYEASNNANVKSVEKPVSKKKTTEIVILVCASVFVVFLAACFYIFTMNLLKRERQIRTVREGYLDAYSEDVTVGEALEDLLSDVEWRTEKGGRHYSYVVCYGECDLVYANGEREPEEVEIWFRVYEKDPNKFKVDRIISNGHELSAFGVIAFLEDVYGVEIEFDLDI